jgi:hypothetical protein
VSVSEIERRERRGGLEVATAKLACRVDGGLTCGQEVGAAVRWPVKSLASDE